MAARRMDISALLCDDDTPNNDDPNSPHISHPVILAPHLRGKHARRMPITPPSNHNYIPGPRDLPSPTTKTSPTDSMSDAHPRPRTIDALLHHPPTASSPRAPPRPSSSSSVNALLNPHPVSSFFYFCHAYLTLSLYTDIFTIFPCTITPSSESLPTHGPRHSRPCCLRRAQAHQCWFYSQRCNQSSHRPQFASR